MANVDTNTQMRSATTAKLRPSAARRRLLMLGALLGTPLICCVVPLRACLYAPGLMDDGPFEGAPCPKAHDSVPAVEHVALFDGSAIEVLPRRPDENAPRVLLRRASGEVQWCRIVEGQRGTRVDQLHLSGVSATAIPGIIAVTGWVGWTYGGESATLHLALNGDLIGYWYSW